MKIFFSTITVLLMFVTDSLYCQDKIDIHYLGHSSFVISINNEISILTDYGHQNAWFEYGWDSPVYGIGNLKQNILTYSHLHDDHFDSTRIPAGVKYILRDSEELHLSNLQITPILTSESDLSQKSNTSYLLEYKGINILHLGDCQANIMYIDSLENKDYIDKEVPKGCDIIFIPIESQQKFIPEVKRFIDLIKPSYVIPMHYWSSEYKHSFLEYIKQYSDKYEILYTNGSNFLYLDSVIGNKTIIVDLQPAEIKTQE